MRVQIVKRFGDFDGIHHTSGSGVVGDQEGAFAQPSLVSPRRPGLDASQRTIGVTRLFDDDGVEFSAGGARQLLVPSRVSRGRMRLTNAFVFATSQASIFASRSDNPKAKPFHPNRGD